VTSWLSHDQFFALYTFTSPFRPVWSRPTLWVPEILP
jgi:hypothetical protein